MNLNDNEQAGHQQNGNSNVSSDSSSFVGVNEGQIDESCIGESPNA